MSVRLSFIRFKIRQFIWPLEQKQQNIWEIIFPPKLASICKKTAKDGDTLSK